MTVALLGLVRLGLRPNVSINSACLLSGTFD